MPIRRRRRIVTDLNDLQSRTVAPIEYRWETVIVDQLETGDYIKTHNYEGTVDEIERDGKTRLRITHPDYMPGYHSANMNGFASVKRRIATNLATPPIPDCHLCGNRGKIMIADKIELCYAVGCQYRGPAKCQHTHTEFLYDVTDWRAKYMCKDCGTTLFKDTIKENADWSTDPDL
jgi:hypothetical protein